MTTPIIWNPVGLVELRHNPLLLAEIMDQAEPAVREAKASAPRDTGAGAESIRSEPDYMTDDGPAVRLGWDVEHYYMRFHEQGTKYLSARPFLVPAVDRYLNMQ